MRARGVDGSNVPSVYGFIAGAGAGAGYSCKAVTSSQCPHEGTSFRRHQHALLQVFSMAGGTLEWRLAWGSGASGGWGHGVHLAAAAIAAPVT